MLSGVSPPAPPEHGLEECARRWAEATLAPKSIAEQVSELIENEDAAVAEAALRAALAKVSDQRKRKT